MTLEQFKSEYVVAEVDGPLETKCWQHANKPHRSGYVQMQLETVRGYAHVFTAEMLYGAMSDEQECDHRCENKWCCNPHHVDVRTAREHRKRHASKITHCPQGHPYDDENTYVSKAVHKDGYYKELRHCKICRRASLRVTNAKRRKNPEYIAMQKAAHDRWRERNKEGINRKQMERYHARQAAYKASLDSTPNPA